MKPLLERIKNIHSALGTKYSSNDFFPTIVSDDYRVVWKEFIASDAITQMYSIWPKNMADAFTAMSFVGYIRDLDKKAVKSKVDLFELSISLVDFKSSARALYEYVNRKALLNHQKRYTKDIHIKNVDYNKFIGAYVNITINGYTSYKAMGRYSLDGLLNSEIKPVLFRQLPDQLSTLDRRKKPKKMYSVDQLKSKPNMWYPLLDDKANNIRLSISRAKYGTLVLQHVFCINTPIFMPQKDKRLLAIKVHWSKLNKL